MSGNDLSRRMRAEWNERAREDANYYVAFARKGQDDDEFFATAAEVVRGLEDELKRLPAGDKRSRRALEIGCGPGRLMRPMSWNFREIHGVDVSDEMIRLANERLAHVPTAFPRSTNGTDLSCYEDEFFDFIYSFAVFQHIPSRELVFAYLVEALRALKPGGILRFQINGLPAVAKQYTTWDGVRISAPEMAEFARAHDVQLLATEGVDTQYLWITLRKRPRGWFRALKDGLSPSAAPRIRNIVNAHSGEPVVPASGRFACMSIWIDHLPADCDLNQLQIEVEGTAATPIFIGWPVFDGVQQVNAQMPANVRTGLVPVKVLRFGELLCEQAWARVIPPRPAVPRLTEISDGINLLSGTRIVSRSVKLFLEELTVPDRLQVRLDGNVVSDLDLFCADPVKMRFEVTFTLPDSIQPGAHNVEPRLGSRLLPTVVIDVV